ncbi:MAG: hypothetical protein K6C34_02975 [Alphaproteobacteria bacterium]|nr:hypothetical protein [Alphaproteobacteria bacterium]
MKPSRGYVALVVAASVPILMLGLRYFLDTRTLKQTEVYKKGDNTVLFKKCANEAALEVAKYWNPGLTLYQQRPSVLRKADKIYNESPTYHSGIMGEAIGAETDGISTAPSMKQISMSTYTAYYPRFRIGAVAADRNLPLYAFYSRVYNLSPTPNTTTLNYEGDPASAAAIDYLEDAEPAATISRCTIWQSGNTTGIRTNMRQECQEQISSGYGGRSGNFTSNPAGGQYTQRTNLADPKLQVSVEGDLIKVITDGDVNEKYQDIGYAKPAFCNVDIILTVPTNMAANNPDNLDSNTLTTGNALIRSGQTGMNTDDFMGTPIYEITRAYHKFLKKFMFTRGVGVGLIPYDANVGIPEARAADWTRPLDLFQVDSWPQSPYLRRAFLYGTKADAFELQALAGEGTIDTSLANHHGPNTYSMNAIFGRAGETTQDAAYGGNTLFKGDILANDAPTSAAKKFVRQYYKPAQFINMLNITSEAGYEGNTSLHPFHIAEITNNVDRIFNLLSIIGPHNGERKNVSNFVFLPITWANNLFQSWTADKAQTTVDTTSATTNSTASGILSTPTKTGSKKAVILTVNKPDFFKENELTYLGYSDDFSEIPMIESDKICFDIDYSDTSKTFPDNKAFDGTIQGAKKILKYETTNGTIEYDSAVGYYQQTTESAAGQLTFPRKHLVKLVVAPKFTGENSGKHKITSETTYIFKGTADNAGPLLPADGTAGYGGVWAGTRGPFEHNLSPYKVKYAVENATVTACNLRRQVLRDYVGQYGRGYADCKPLILRSGTVATRPSESHAYHIGTNFGYNGSVSVQSSKDFSIRVHEFMDPCVSLLNSPVYGIAGHFSEYSAGINKYLISGLNHENVRAYALTMNWSVTRGNETRTYSSATGWQWYWFHVGYFDSLSETENNTVTFDTTDQANFLEMYLCNAENRNLNYDDPKLDNIHKTLCTNTNIFDNEGVYLLNNWICFNGDAKLEVTVSPNSAAGGYVTFFDDNRENVTASITVNGTTYSDIKEEKEIYVEAENISGESSPYSIPLTNMQNIRLVSAEITNRAYTKKTPTITLSGITNGTGTAYLETNVKKPITLKTHFEWPPRPMYSGTIDFTTNYGSTLTSGTVITNGDLSYETTSGTMAYSNGTISNHAHWPLGYWTSGTITNGIRSATGKLSFPGGKLLKIVVEPWLCSNILTVDLGGSNGIENVKWYNMRRMGTTNNKIQAVSVNGTVAESEDGIHFHKVYDLSKPATKYIDDYNATSFKLETGGASSSFSSGWYINGVYNLFLNSNGDGKTNTDIACYRRMINGSLCRISPAKYSSTNAQYLWGQESVCMANGICVVHNGSGVSTYPHKTFYSYSNNYTNWSTAYYKIDQYCRILGYNDRVGWWICGSNPTCSAIRFNWAQWNGGDSSLQDIESTETEWYGGEFVNDRSYAVCYNSPGKIATTDHYCNWKLEAYIGGSGYRNITYWKDCLWCYHENGTQVCRFPFGSIQFTNITSSDLTKTDEYPVTGKKTFYIDISKTNGSNVTFNMKNLRLISAELIPNEFTAKIPTCSLSGTTEATDGAEHECYITTNVQDPMTLKVDRIPLVFSEVDVGFSSGHINYGNGKYVVNSWDSQGLYVGSSLTSLSKVVNGTFENPVAYGNGAFVATSTDGAYADWGEGFNRISNNRVYSCCFGDNLFVVGDLSSVNGKDFTSISSNTAVFYGNGLYVGGAYDIYTSPTGTGDWTKRGHTDKANWPGCYGNGKFVIPAYDGTILTSSDGETWTSVNSGTSNNLLSVCWTGKRFIAVGWTIITSTDGENWYSVPTEFNDNVPDVKIPSGLSAFLQDIQVLNSNEVVITAGNKVLRAPMPQGYVKYYNVQQYTDVYNTFIDDQTITISPSTYKYEDQGNGTWQIKLTLKDAQVSDLKFIDEQGICNVIETPPQTAQSYITYKAPDGITDVVQYPTPGETITISPETHYYEKLNNGNYRITLNVTSNETTTATRLSDPAFKDITSDAYEFNSLRMPEMSRYVNYNKKVNNWPEVSHPDLISLYSVGGLRWDDITKGWMTKANYAVVNSGNVHHYWQSIPGNGYLIVDSQAMHGSHTWDYYDNGAVQVQISGLYNKRFPFDKDHNNFVFMDIYNADLYPAKWEIAGYTLPINTMLYYGMSGNTPHAYQWQSDTNGNIKWKTDDNNNATTIYDATAACQEVTKSACAKLKTDYGDDLRIYVIKYRKQDQYKPYPGANAQDWDYSYIDDCASGSSRVYDVGNKADLESTLDAIATDIKTWAGYEEAHNVPWHTME